MTLEIGTDELPIPGPVIFGICGRMESGDYAAVGDEGFERRLFNGVEDIPSRVQENDDAVLRQLDFVENRCFFRIDDRKTVFVPQRTNRRDSGRNRIVPVSRSLREYENSKTTRLCCRPTGSRCDAHPHGHCRPEAHALAELFTHRNNRSDQLSIIRQVKRWQEEKGTSFKLNWRPGIIGGTDAIVFPQFATDGGHSSIARQMTYY